MFRRFLAKNPTADDLSFMESVIRFELGEAGIAVSPRRTGKDKVFGVLGKWIFVRHWAYYVASTQAPEVRLTSAEVTEIRWKFAKELVTTENVRDKSAGYFSVNSQEALNALAKVIKTKGTRHEF